MGSWAQELALLRVATHRQTGTAIMSPIKSARLKGHDPYAYLKEVLTRLPTQQMIEIDQLLPRMRQPVSPHMIFLLASERC